MKKITFILLGIAAILSFCSCDDGVPRERPEGTYRIVYTINHPLKPVTRTTLINNSNGRYFISYLHNKKTYYLIGELGYGNGNTDIAVSPYEITISEFKKVD